MIAMLAAGGNDNGTVRVLEPDPPAFRDIEIVAVDDAGNITIVMKEVPKRATRE